VCRTYLQSERCVRFANKYSDGFKAAKNFVLFVIYIWEDGKVSRYSLLQEPNGPEVCWTLYITKLTDRVVVVDENGFICNNGAFLLTRRANARPAGVVSHPHRISTYQQSDPSKRFIVKKVYKQSNELEFLKRLNTFQLKSKHIISLHEPFQTQSTSWAILPEMDSVASFAPNELHGKVAQVSWGLVEGVAYLHKFCIAHRDIKPESLVVDRDFCLKIIDFDVAM